MRCRGRCKWRRATLILLVSLLAFSIVFITYSIITLHRVEYERGLTGVLIATKPTGGVAAPGSSLCEVGPFDTERYPNCVEKLDWLKNGWKTHGCYADHGVDGTACSFRRYLSHVEHHCPPMPGEQEQVENEDESGHSWATPDLSLDALFAHFVDTPQNFVFIKHRISRMWPQWLKAYEANRAKYPKKFTRLKRKKIILHLGFLSKASGIKFGEKAGKGGPLGELVQWSDLLASLHILGHDLQVSTENPTLARVVGSLPPLVPCPPLPSSKSTTSTSSAVDLIFTDIMGMRALKKLPAFLVPNRCRIRLLDSFGTHAQFNNPAYFKAHKEQLGAIMMKNPWGGHNLDLRQFFTLYPHTHDNTFLGFVVNVNDTLVRAAGRANARRGVLVYGKEKYMWEKASALIEAVQGVTEVHATVADADAEDALPRGVINHGLLEENEFHELLSTVRIFLGLGFPYEGPAPLEAVAHGAVFINPSFAPPKGRLTDKFFAEKPTLRALTSQCPYLEWMGAPWVRTIDTSDIELLQETIRSIEREEQVEPRVPFELTAEGMVQRVALIVDRLDTCGEGVEVWPPKEEMKILEGEVGDSCEAACSARSLRCEPAFFPLANRRNMQKETFKCDTVSEAPKIYAPMRCTVQDGGPRLFSCSASSNVTRRVCPCRESMREQSQLCKTCLD